MKRLSSVLIVGLMVVGMAGWGCSNTTPETPKTDTKMSSTEKPADKMADATKPADTKPADAPKPAETASTKPADTTPAPTTPVKPATPEKTVALNTSGDTVKVGILHSLSGTMAISETSLKDVELMAIDQINEAGGVLGKKVVPVVVDPASNWDLFAEKAKELITVDKVVATFGCWTSVSRKSVLPVFEEYNQLLFYPLQYEAEEQSLNVFYAGATPNQQILPAVDYLMSLGYKKFYIIGTDYVYPRTAAKVTKAYLLTKGIPATDMVEEFTPFHYQDYQTIIGKIKQFASGGNTCVISNINGDSNVPFYKEFANQGLTAADCPIMCFSMAEDELRAMDVPPLVGHMAGWNYFMSLKNPENLKFVKDFKEYCVKNKLPGGADRVTDDPMCAAYDGVQVWKLACEKAGSFDPDKVRAAALGLEFESPSGKRKVAENQHTWMPCFVGEIQKDGQFKIVYRHEDLIAPESYSKYLHPDGKYPAPTGGPKK